MTKTDVVIDEKIQIEISEPKDCKVIFLNDNTTPMEFVIEVLQLIFKHTFDTAQSLTLQIHEEGSGVAGIYSYEIAEQKVAESISVSRGAGYPLALDLEEL